MQQSRLVQGIPFFLLLLLISKAPCGGQATSTTMPHRVAAKDSMGAIVTLRHPARSALVTADGVSELLRALSGSIRIIDQPGGVSPDILVISDDRRGKEMAGFGADIPVFVYAPRNFLELADAFMALGVLTGEESRGIKLAAQTSSAVKHIRTIICRIPPGSFARVFIQENMCPLVTCGASSFISALVSEAGGKNLFLDRGGSIIAVDHAEVIRRAPDVILVAQGAASCSSDNNPGPCKLWSDTPAGKSGKVYSIDLSAGLTPGTKSATLLAKVAKLLHPDLIP